MDCRNFRETIHEFHYSQFTFIEKRRKLKKNPQSKGGLRLCFNFL
jgi:hypothetical protein